MGEKHKCRKIQPERWFIHKVFAGHKTRRPVLCIKKTFSAEGSYRVCIIHNCNGLLLVSLTGCPLTVCGSLVQCTRTRRDLCPCLSASNNTIDYVYHTSSGEHNDPLYTHVYTLFQYIDVHSNSVCVSVCLKWPSTQKCHIVATCFTIVSHTTCLYIQYDMRMNTSLWWIQLGGSHQLYTHVAIIRVHSIGWFQYKTPRIVIGRRRAALKCTQYDIMSSVSQVLSA